MNFRSLCLAIALASTANAQDPGELARGKIVVRAGAAPGSDVPTVVVTAMIDAPPEKVWAIVSDCAHYKDRLPRIAAARELAVAGNTHTCEVTIHMPFPMSNLTAVTEAVHDQDGRHFSRRWKLVRGDYKRNEGSWDVRPFDTAGTQSLVVYTVHAEPNVAVPDFIRNKAQKSALADLMERLRVESKKL